MEFRNFMFRYLEISWDFGANCRSGNPARAIKRKNFSLKSLSLFSNKLKNDSNFSVYKLDWRLLACRRICLEDKRKGMFGSYREDKRHWTILLRSMPKR